MPHMSASYMASLLTLMETWMWEAGWHAFYDLVLLFFKWRKDGILTPHLILSILVIIFYCSCSQSVQWNWFHGASVLAHRYFLQETRKSGLVAIYSPWSGICSVVEGNPQRCEWVFYNFLKISECCTLVIETKPIYLPVSLTVTSIKPCKLQRTPADVLKI